MPGIQYIEFIDMVPRRPFQHSNYHKGFFSPKTITTKGRAHEAPTGSWQTETKSET